eukprot:m.175880 g.175880  ORF g.175880 m.175880 type:complete len:71 (+) comp31832_c3_seq3:394-606(+)
MVEVVADINQSSSSEELKSVSGNSKSGGGLKPTKIKFKSNLDFSIVVIIVIINKTTTTTSVTTTTTKQQQ